MFANASVNFLTDQQHFSLNKNQIWGSKTRSSLNFYSKTYADVHGASVFQDCQKYFLKTDLDSAWRVLHDDYAYIGEWASIRAQMVVF